MDIALTSKTPVLANKTLARINAPQVALPGFDYLKLPVKVLQFGTGVLLRGLTDHVIDKANRAGIFNGRIAVIKSTNTGSTDAFTDQDNLYTLQLKGINNKQLVEETIINTSISHVLSAVSEWDRILIEVESPDLKVIVSNTTEVGLQLVEEDINQKPPVSYPAKLLALLYHRYKTFNGSVDSGLVIIPTELLPDNAILLKNIITQLIAYNKLDADFEKWLDENNYFCNSLVDKIVTGRPSKQEQQLFEEKNGYHDELLIVAEPYCLWAIEGNDKVKSILSFEQADDGVKVIPDIETHRELKLRLLNGTHTLSCAVALIKGFDMVNTATNNIEFYGFLQDVMAEIRSVMQPTVDQQVLADFSDNVLDRFKNPYIQHQWINIAQQYTTKLITRVIPLLNSYYKLFNQAPVKIAKGFAAYLFLMSNVKQDDSGLYLVHNDVKFPFKDDKGEQLIEKYKTVPLSNIAAEILGNAEIWGEDLTQLPMFAYAVQHYLDKIISDDLVIWGDE